MSILNKSCWAACLLLLPFQVALAAQEGYLKKLSTLSTLTPSKYEELIHNPNLPPFFR